MIHFMILYQPSEVDWRILEIWNVFTISIMEIFKKIGYKNKNKVILTQTEIKTTKGRPGRLGGLEDPRG